MESVIICKRIDEKYSFVEGGIKNNRQSLIQMAEEVFLYRVKTPRTRSSSHLNPQVSKTKLRQRYNTREWD